MKKTQLHILLLVIIVCYVSQAYAYPGVYTTFSDGTSEVNVTYNNGTSTNNIKYVNLGVGSDLLIGLFNITGYNHTIIGSSTISYIAHSIPLSTTTTDANEHGMKILTDSDVDVTLMKVRIQTATNSPTRAYLKTAHNAGLIATATISGGVATFSPYIQLNRSTNYYVMVDKLGASFDVKYNLDVGGQDYPIIRDGFSWVAGARETTGDSSTSALSITDLYVNVTSIGDSGYPRNVSVYLNDDTLVYNFGSGNNSIFAKTKQINISPYLSTITTYPTKLTFYSNSTGLILVGDLYFEDSVRNFTFNFFDEQDGSLFDVNATNTTLTIKCPGSQYEYDITTTTYTTGVGCDSFDLIKASVRQNTQNYYRTLALPPGAGTSPELDWYLVNLNNKSVVQVILVLDDTTGYRWSGSTVSLQRPVNSTSGATIIEQDFDVDNKVYLYLMQDQQYTVRITNAYGEVWSGEFIADSAIEKTITLPGIGFGADNYWETDLSLNYTFSSEEGVLNARFRDLGGYTNYANFSIINISDGNVIVSASLITDFTEHAYFNYTNPLGIYGNNSYATIFWFNHSVLGWQTERRVFGDYSGGVSPGAFLSDWEDITKWFVFLFSILIILSFGSKDSHIGLGIILVMLVVFKYMGWLDWVNGITLGVLGVLISINWWRKEEVNEG